MIETKDIQIRINACQKLANSFLALQRILNSEPEENDVELSLVAIENFKIHPRILALGLNEE